MLFFNDSVVHSQVTLKQGPLLLFKRDMLTVPPVNVKPFWQQWGFL